ncbi:MAG: hypothetical protein PHS45_01920 [Bacilli bacterium]|nr:hypothetical protein [Bacilli bacterium]
MNVIIANKHQAELSNLEIDVIKSLNGEFAVDEIVNTFKNFYFYKMILDITAIKGYKDPAVFQKLSVALDVSKIILLLDDSDESESSLYLSKLISMGIYNFTRKPEGIMYLYNNPNTYRDVAHIHQLEELTDEVATRVADKKVKVLGVKNMTDHAGATTLIYMLKKQLERLYAVAAVEIDKNDFVYFNDKDMISTTKDQVSSVLMKLRDKNIVLVDLNSYPEEGICNDVLYLIEPSTVRLNKMFRRDRRIFEKLKGKKIVLNKSLLSSSDVLEFEYESKSKVYYSVPPLNERKSNHPVLEGLLTKLGFIRQNVEQKDDKNKILGLFKF